MDIQKQGAFVMNLLIVESPGKVKKIQSFLGQGWTVAASVGHVRDLPPREIGVVPPDFSPKYEPTERGADVLKRLAGLVKQADAVYLATDPDREGEAIAWHLKEALRLQNPRRVTYSEITESAVKKAIAAPRAVNMRLVAAQEARRVLDRLCGYMVSGPLSNAAGQKLSAGRVQSPAVRLVVDREREIRNFKATTHFGAELSFPGNWTATWKPALPEGQEYMLDKMQAEKAAAVRAVTVQACTESESRSAPPAPFTTSTLQQAASSALKFNPKATMQLAQRLYEQGAITYMRTDSPNLSAEAVAEARAYAQAQGWPLVDKPRTWKSKDGAQEAHEAIRPVHIEQETAGETSEEQSLYKLIRLRVLAAQLADAVYAVRTVSLTGDGMEYEAKGRTLTTPGWKTISAQADEDEGETAEPDNPVPALQINAAAQAADGRVITKTTKPPARFTEASLVRELEKRGIGRPSTYAAILDTIQTREYVKTEKRQLMPTPSGEAVVDGLSGRFSFIEFEFTRKMEDGLDGIAEGKHGYKAVISAAYGQLERELSALAQAAGPGRACPLCGKPLRRCSGTSKKTGQPYDFFSCTGYPDCKHSENPDGSTGRPSSSSPQTPNGPPCPKCGKPTVRKVKAGAYDFYGCSGYPECKGTISNEKSSSKTPRTALKKPLAQGGGKAAPAWKR